MSFGIEEVDSDIKNPSFVIPDDESLSSFINGNISPYTHNDFDSFQCEEIKETILNLIIAILIKNTNLELVSYKSNDLQVENH